MTNLQSARSRLKALEPLATELNKLSDAFGSELKHIEEKLHRLNFGMRVDGSQPFGEPEAVDGSAMTDTLEALGFPPEADSDQWYVESRSRLAYAKWRGDWRVLVETEHAVYERDSNGAALPEPKEVTTVHSMPLLEAPRDVRLAAALAIDDLLDAVRDAAEKKVNVLKKFIP